MNSILVTMQSYALNTVRRQIQANELPLDAFDLKRKLGPTEYTAEQALTAKEGTPDWDKYQDLCMRYMRDCQADVYMFYLFKSMETGSNEYAEEPLQDCASFEPYLPLFT